MKSPSGQTDEILSGLALLTALSPARTTTFPYPEIDLGRWGSRTVCGSKNSFNVCDVPSIA
ncbi:hypothetical protein, partial [Rothia koreensis]|uniref:hypothetical protein n=1 Tax=Rothia koreensis TaxID=592378 RepID=UPI00197E4B52